MEMTVFYCPHCAEEKLRTTDKLHVYECSNCTARVQIVFEYPAVYTSMMEMMWEEDVAGLVELRQAVNAELEKGGGA